MENGGKMDQDELVIDGSNFDQYFFDVRKNDWKKGQVMARYRAVANFVDTYQKRNVIDLLKLDKAVPATRLMRKYHGATDIHSIQVLIQMCKDLLKGMSDDEVAAKPYEMNVEYFFYTKKEHIPDDPHWDCISLRGLGDWGSVGKSGWAITQKYVDADGNELDPEDVFNGLKMEDEEKESKN